MDRRPATSKLWIDPSNSTSTLPDADIKPNVAVDLIAKLPLMCDKTVIDDDTKPVDHMDGLLYSTPSTSRHHGGEQTESPRFMIQFDHSYASSDGPSIDLPPVPTNGGYGASTPLAIRLHKTVVAGPDMVIHEDSGLRDNESWSLRLKCNKYNSSARTTGALISRIATSHTDVNNKMYKCSMLGCPFSADDPSTLAHHEDEQPHRRPGDTAFVIYRCHKCKYMTSIRGALRRHGRAVHEGEHLVESATATSSTAVDAVPDDQDEIGEPDTQDVDDRDCKITNTVNVNDFENQNGIEETKASPQTQSECTERSLAAPCRSSVRIQSRLKREPSRSSSARDHGDEGSEPEEQDVHDDDFKMTDADDDDGGGDDVDEDSTNAKKYTYPKRYACNHCSFIGVHRSNLRHHMHVHSNIRPFNCDECSYRGKTLNNLTNHKRIHDSARPFQCTQCAYGAKRRRELIEHMRTHTRETPYKCDQCGYAASTRSNLTKHVKTVHVGEKTLPFKCELCSYATGRLTHLRRHEHKAHDYRGLTVKAIGTVEENKVTVSDVDVYDDVNCVMVANSEMNCLGSDRRDIKIKIEQEMIID